MRTLAEQSINECAGDGHLEGEFCLHALPHLGPRNNGATHPLLPVTFIFIVNLTGSRITLEADLWPCL